MDNMTITNAQYISNEEGVNTTIRADVDGVTSRIPLDPSNRHYSEIMRQVEAGTLVIQEAD